MNAPAYRLFRKEATDFQANRLYGDINIAVPISWQVIGYLLLAILIAALVFLSTASYSRVEIAQGVLVLDRGVVAIVPGRPGIVADLRVRNGQQVAAGNPLAQVRSEEDMAGGDPAPSRVLTAMGAQDDRLASQTQLVLGAAAADRERLREQIQGLEREIASLDTQLAVQQRMIEIAEEEFQSIRRVGESGFISRRDVAAREGNLLSRRQQLAQIDQARASKRADLAAARRTLAQISASAQAQAEGLQSSRAELAQRLAQVEATRGYSLNAPVAGTVTALTGRIGQAISANQPLMMIVPTGARLRVELAVPTQAIGFIEIGQEVRIAVDAFPYQQFGTVKGRVADISSVAVARTSADGSVNASYIVTAELEQPWIAAFGRRQPFLPGMTLTARIVTERRTLLEWMFEPLFAVARR